MDDALQEVYEWGQRHLTSWIMLDYQLHRVNGQTPGKVFFLLRQRGSLRATVEIEVAYVPADNSPYQAVFSVLPFSGVVDRPAKLRPTFVTQQAVIQWLKTGQLRP